MLKSEKILNYPVVSCGLESCIAQIIAWISEGGKAKTLVCANPHSLAGAAGDNRFRAALLDADMLVPDGAGIVLASRILNGRIRRRITGSDIFQELNETMNRQGQGSCFFLGSTQATLARLCKRMRKDFPNLEPVGAYAPPFMHEFTEEDNRHMVNTVNAAAPDVLWVGMTAPKQEKWVYRNRNKLNVKFIAAVGAVFDFYTGNVKRSHPIFQALGLEWLPRLLQQPGRLWRRTLISAPVFLLLVLKQKFMHR